jgi:hypothetical protein
LSFKEKIQQRILVQFEAHKPLQPFILKELALALNKFESIEKPQVSLFEDSEAMAELKQKLQEIFDEINENNHPVGKKSWLHHWHLTKKILLEELEK